MEEKVKQINTSNKEAHKEFYTRIQELEKKDVMHDTQYQNILTSIDEIKTSLEKEGGERKQELEKLNKKLDELMSKPAKKWEGIVSSGISAILGGIIAYILYQLGFKK